MCIRDRYYEELKKLLAKTFTKRDTKYIACLNEMGLLFKNMQQFKKAESYLLDAKEIQLASLSADHPDLANTFNNLGILYKNMGRYEEAAHYYNEVLRIRKIHLGTLHLLYTSTLTNLANLYIDLANYSLAEKYFLELIQLRGKAHGQNHPYYATSLEGLAQLYRAMGIYNKAIAYSMEVNTIRDRSLGSFHRDVYKRQHLLAHAYKTLNNYELAESYHREALEIQKSITGKEHTAYANSLISLAKIFMETSRDSLAELFLTEAQTIFKRVIGSDYAEYATVLGYLAIVNEKRSNVELADNLLYEYMVLSQEKLIKSVLYLSPEELNKYADRIARNLATLLSINYRRNMMGNHSANLNKAIFNTALFQKGFVLNAANRLNLLAAETSESNELNTTLQSYKRRLAKEYAKLYSEQNKQLLIELEEKANIVEKDLVKKVNGYSDASTQVQWNDVKLKLQPGDAVLEFVNFKLDFPKKTDSIIYAVLLLRFEDSIPVFIPLFEEQQLSLILQGHSAGKQAEIYASRGVSPIRVQDYTSLYNLVWKPIEMYLINSKKIYLATSGNLHRLNRCV